MMQWVLKPEENLGELAVITKKLNIDKIEQGRNHKINFDAMEYWFREDIRKMTDSLHGITDEDGRIKVRLNGYNTIWYMIIDFDDKTGLYLGPSSIVAKKRRPKGSPILSSAQEYKDARTKEYNDILKRFALTAERLGYLI